jgi:hypothetical protein
MRRPGSVRLPDRTGRAARSSNYGRAASGRNHTVDDGTIAPTAAASSLPFAPEIVIPACRRCIRATASSSTRSTASSIRSTTSFTATNVKLADGRVDPAFGWIANDYLGIDQGRSSR